MNSGIFHRYILFCLFISGSLIPVQAKETIKIAVIFSKSGIAAPANLYHLQAVRYAFEEINERGGILGKQVKILEFDNHSTPIQSRLAAKKAVRANVSAVVGAAWSSHSLAMAPLLQKEKIPMISPSSTNPKVTRIGNYIFRACFIDPFQGYVLAKLAAHELKASTSVIIEDITSAYSLGLSSVFNKHFQLEKGTVLSVLGYKKTRKDFEDLLLKVKNLNPDVLFIPGHDESGLIVKQAQEMGIKATMIGGDGWAYRQFFSNGGHELKIGYYSSHWSKDVDNPKSREFVKKFRKVYDINDFSGVAYDAVMLLADAIQRAGSTDREKIRDALENTKNFQGVTGSITLDSNGDPVKPAVIMKIINGKAIYYKTISP